MTHPVRPARRVRRRDERGGVAVLVVGCVGVLLWLGAALGVVAAMVVAHRTAQSAADLAALAGAADVVGGDPCGRAAAVARANGAELRSCQVEGLEVGVQTVVVGPRWLGHGADLVAAARAGPGAAQA